MNNHKELTADEIQAIRESLKLLRLKYCTCKTQSVVEDRHLKDCPFRIKAAALWRENL